VAVPRKLLALVSLVLGLALVWPATAFPDNGGLTPVTPRSPNAEDISDSYWLILAFTGGIFVLVEGLLILFVVRFRSRGRPRDVEGPQIRGHTNLELAWTAAPVLFLAVIAGFIFYKLPGVDHVPDARAAGDLDVRVEGHQFYWQFGYPNDVIAVDRLRVPLGRVVKLEVTAPEYDVIHSWWIPALGGKIDAIPGATNRTWFRADRVGVYEGRCAEFCGIQHAEMEAAVEVMPAEDFDRWLADEATRQEEGRSRLGAMTYEGACAKCHGFGGEGLIGPALKGNPILSDREALATVIRNGRGEMPAVGRDWSDRQLDAVARYLRRFGQGGTPGGG
jgi:cytochrome c oxidase subunit II